MPRKFGTALFSGALEKTNFLWQKERCRAVDTRDYFSCFLWGGGEKARKKGKLNPHVLSLLKGPESKPETKLYLRSWQPLGALSSQPARRSEKSPPERIQPQLGSTYGGGEAMPHPEPGKQRRNWEWLLLNTSSARSPIHIHKEAKKPARPVVWEICLLPQILNCMVKGT